MDVESLLRDALDLKRVPGEPDLGFEARVVRSLPDRPRRHSRLMPAFVGLAAVLAIAVVAAPWYLGGLSKGGPAGVSASPSASSATAVATLTPTPAILTHARSWGLEFDYPAAWSLSDESKTSISRPTQVARQVFGYVGTKTPETVCPEPQGKVTFFCTSVWSLAPGDLVLRFQKGEASGMAMMSGSLSRPPSVTTTTVGGLPAWFSRSSGSVIDPQSSVFRDTETATGADETMVWQLPGNGTNLPSTPTLFRIVAALRGPNVQALEAEVQAVVASMKYDPAVIPLPSDPAARNTQSLQALTRALGYSRWAPSPADRSLGETDHPAARKIRNVFTALGRERTWLNWARRYC